MTMAELETGTKMKDRYTLKEFKGSGSFGEVWLAHDEVIDRDVAVKIYISLDPRGVEEFRSEYVMTLGISHPNLLTTTYFDVWEHHPFLIMKYCARGSAASLAGKMDERALWQFIHDVAAGLGYLHGMPEPIVHQDIKPDNILVDDSGRFLITDFGISKRLRTTMRKQSTRGIGAGATAYMGPERFESDPSPVKASDIWSLGASIHELATGELPFSGLGGGMQRAGAEIPVLDGHWSAEMNLVMRSCLAKETWDRPTARQLELFAEAILNGQPAKPDWPVPASIKADPSATRKKPAGIKATSSTDSPDYTLLRQKAQEEVKQIMDNHKLFGNRALNIIAGTCFLLIISFAILMCVSPALAEENFVFLSFLSLLLFLCLYFIIIPPIARTIITKKVERKYAIKL